MCLRSQVMIDRLKRRQENDDGGLSMPDRGVRPKNEGAAGTVYVIMAGGRGERFWPASRAHLPKQFLDLGRPRTFFQEAVDRLAPLCDTADVYVITGEEYAELVHDQAPSLPERNIITEPMPRNTAACLALAAFHLRAIHPDKDPVMTVLTADHLIDKRDAFVHVLRAAAQVAAEEEAVVVLGVPPTAPVTGYGYIRRSTASTRWVSGLPVYETSGFREKPNLETAQEYVASGEFYWNSGMFIWRLSHFLKLLARFLPAHYGSLAALFQDGAEPDRQALATAFAALEPVSIDYGIMEKTDRILVLPAEIGWDDVGSWASIADHLPSCGSNTVIGEATLVDAEDCLVWSDRGHVAVVGLRKMIVVRVGEAILICPKARAQDVRRIVEELRRNGRIDLI